LKKGVSAGIPRICFSALQATSQRHQPNEMPQYRNGEYKRIDFPAEWKTSCIRIVIFFYEYVGA